MTILWGYYTIQYCGDSAILDNIMIEDGCFTIARNDNIDN